jgi:hypothetical protein
MANYDLTYEGSRVQGILDTGNSLKDAGYIFRGEATPSTVPGTPTERVAYIGGPGTYTNFGSSITVGAGCICVFKYTGSAWSNQVINTGLDSAVNTLQSAITAINNNIGNGYVYAGVATPSTSPVTGKVFYLAVQAGTYTNFGNAVVTAGLNVIKYNGSAWSVDQVIAIDAEPTQGSANLVKSGGVLNSIIQNGPAFDLSAYNAQGGVLATYADLSAALTALKQFGRVNEFERAALHWPCGNIAGRAGLGQKAVQLPGPGGRVQQQRDLAGHEDAPEEQIGRASW